MSKERLAKNTAIMGLGILVSRILGFVRDVIMMAVYGTGVYSQAFVMAFMIPNILRQFVGEGVVNTAIVPVLADYFVKKEKDEFWRLVSILLNIFILLLAGITLLGVVFAPVIVRIMAPGFLADPEKFSITVKLTRILFPYIFLIGLTAFLMGLLSVFKRFAVPAFSMAFLNFSMLAAFLIFYPDVPIVYVAVSVLIGGALQVGTHLIALRGKGPLFNLGAGISHVEIGRVRRLMGPRIIGAGVYQINMVIDKMLASFGDIAGNGAVVALFIGNRLFQLPLALFGVATSQVALASLSLHAAEEDMTQFRGTISFALRNALFFTVPAAAGLMVCAFPIIKVLFERGNFTAGATAVTSQILCLYSLGLPAYGCTQTLVASFYALKDTVTPLKVTSVSLLLNIILNIILMFPLKAAGLALATSISGFLSLILLTLLLRKRLGPFIESGTKTFIYKISAAAVTMGAAAFALVRLIVWERGAAGAVCLLCVLAVSMGIYFAVCYLLRVEELRKIAGWISRR